MALNNFVKSIRNIMRNDAGINGDAQRIEQIAWMLFLKIYDEKENDWEFNEDKYQSFIPEPCRWRSWAKDQGDGNALTADALLEFVNNTLFPTLKALEVTPDTPIRSTIVRTTFEDANQYMKDGVLLRQVINVIDALDLGDYNESHAFGEIYETILKEMQSAGSAGEFYTPRALTDFMAETIDPQIGEKMADFACGTGGFITSWLKALDKKVQTAQDKEAHAQSIYGIEKKQFPYMLCVTNMLLHDIEAPRILHDNSLSMVVQPLFCLMAFFLVLTMRNWLSKKDFYVNSICIQLLDCPAAFSRHIQALPPIFFSSPTKRQKDLKKDSARKKHGSIALTCQKDTNTSPRQSQCA